MKAAVVTFVVLVLSSAASADTLKPVSPLTKGDVCGSVVKVGDLDEGRNSILLKAESGEFLKIYVESHALAISPELLRATQAMANDLTYCARVSGLSDQTAYLVNSSIQKKSL